MGPSRLCLATYHPFLPVGNAHQANGMSESNTGTNRRSVRSSEQEQASATNRH